MIPIIVIAEGGKKSGMGHIVRQFALCSLLGIQDKVTAYIQADWSEEELKTINFFFKSFRLIQNTSHVLQEISDGTLVLMDGYNFDIEKINELKKTKKLKIVFVADVHEHVPDCDILINHLPWIKNDTYSNAIILKKLLGSKYAILREPFYSKKQTTDQNRILICLGGSDIEPEIVRIFNALKNYGYSASKIDILHNKKIEGLPIENLHFNLSAQQVHSLISNAHLCFITPGNISYEVFSINKPVVMGYVSESQKTIVKQFHDLHLCYNIGSWHEADFKNLSQWITEATDTQNHQATFFKDLNLSNIKNELSLYIN